jgi:hypothetical protein
MSRGRAVATRSRVAATRSGSAKRPRGLIPADGNSVAGHGFHPASTSEDRHTFREVSGVRNWQVTLGQALAGGVGTIVALTIAGWPDDAAEAAWVGLGGFLVGLALAFAGEYLLRLHADVRRLRDVDRQLEAEREQRAEERRIWSYRIEAERRRAEVAAVGTEVFGGAFNEAQATGHFLPVSALMARMQMLQKAKESINPCRRWTSGKNHRRACRSSPD